ncbi:glyoxalase [Halobacteriales archaeon QS_8_69_73]|nr:MAG: glyoxalase [Halobacteriales archaeon QS_8_69_73]
MDGIVFFGTERLETVVDFYRDIGAEVWLEQPDCTILRFGDFRVGFCARETAETDGIVTVVVDTRAAVDRLADDLGAAVEEPPRYNDRYEIYQCFAADPEGRTVEVQTFEHDG